MNYHWPERPEFNTDQCDELLESLQAQAFAAFPWFVLTAESLDEDIWAARPGDKPQPAARSLIHAWDDIAPAEITAPTVEELLPYFDIVIEMARIRKIRENAEQWEIDSHCD